MQKLCQTVNYSVFFHKLETKNKNSIFVQTNNYLCLDETARKLKKLNIIKMKKFIILFTL